MRIKISVNGCDDTTVFEMDVSIVQYVFLLDVAKLSQQHSEYSCQPRIEIEDKTKSEGSMFTVNQGPET